MEGGQVDRATVVGRYVVSTGDHRIFALQQNLTSLFKYGS